METKSITTSLPDRTVIEKAETIIDPTKNVLDLVQAAVQRQDDLRREAEKFMQAELGHVRAVGELRATHAHELAEKEANRLDAIRQVDMLNGTAAAKASVDAIKVLAATTALNAEKLRNDLQASAAQIARQTTETATAMAAQSAITNKTISDRLTALERTSYQGAGKSEGISSSWAVLIAVVTFVLASIGVGVALITHG